jgi:hypothetical protein
MLTSITPLGERSRNSSWGVTVTAFVLGSTAAGALLGAALGVLGGLSGVLPPASSVAFVALAGAALGGVSLDLGLAGLRLPTVPRQVSEDSLHAYRGWVYGIGFGFQLGLGFTTVVSSSAIYLAFFAGLLSGSALAGALVGAAFGLLRAAPLLLGAQVDTPDRLFLLGRRLAAWRRPSVVLAVCAQTALAIAALAVALG